MLFFRRQHQNQTEFARISTLLEKVSIDEENLSKLKESRKRIKKIFIAMGVLLLTFISLILFYLFKPKPKIVKKPKKPIATKSAVIMDDSLLGQIKSLRSSLEKNDPMESELFFPNVARSIYIDPPRRQ